MIGGAFISLCDAVGKKTVALVTLLGEYALFVVTFFLTFIRFPLNKRQLVKSMYLVSVDSFGIVFLTGICIGLALALQSYIGFVRVHAEQFTGLVATLGIVRELGPVLTGIIISAKTGSAIAAEIATMKITEQIDALRTISVNPVGYLVVPRVIAVAIMLPFVTVFTVLFGLSASYFLCVHVLHINAQAYTSIVKEYLKLSDITGGLIKSLIFGLIIGVTGTYSGYTSGDGARGVGKATTNAVVVSSVMILIGNYILSSLLYSSGIS